MSYWNGRVDQSRQSGCRAVKQPALLEIHPSQGADTGLAATAAATATTTTYHCHYRYHYHNHCHNHNHCTLLIIIQMFCSQKTINYVSRNAIFILFGVCCLLFWRVKFLLQKACHKFEFHSRRKWFIARSMKMWQWSSALWGHEDVSLTLSLEPGKMMCQVSIQSRSLLCCFPMGIVLIFLIYTLIMLFEIRVVNSTKFPQIASFT